jgi:hypothetical protein
MGGEHWELYLRHCIELDISPDRRAIPEGVQEQQKQVLLAEKFVFIANQ